nr:hypothetical protein [Klebsiella pneumoniae]
MINKEYLPRNIKYLNRENIFLHKSIIDNDKTSATQNPKIKSPYLVCLKSNTILSGKKNAETRDNKDNDNKTQNGIIISPFRKTYPINIIGVVNKAKDTPKGVFNVK